MFRKIFSVELTYIHTYTGGSCGGSVWSVCGQRSEILHTVPPQLPPAQWVTMLY
jgi:hypothetical protein